LVLLHTFPSFLNSDLLTPDGAEAWLSPSAVAHALATDNVQHNIPIINQPPSQTF
jgi:hypothetical protein